MYPVGKIKYLNHLICSKVGRLNVLSAHWISILFLFLFNLPVQNFSFGQGIEFNHRLNIQNRSIILRNIMMNNDSLLVSGEIGTDSLGLAGFFLLNMDSLGNLGTIKNYRDPSLQDHALLDGRNPLTINANNKIVLSGHYLEQDNAFFMILNKQFDTILYNDYESNFKSMVIHGIAELHHEYYIVGMIQTQNFDVDVFLQKIDSSGNKIWEKTYGMPSKDETGRAVILEDDGLTIMVSESFDNTPTIKNDTRYWIRFMHVDTSGSIVRDWREEVTGEEGWSGTLLKYRNDYIYTCNTIGDEIGIGPLTGGQIVRRDSSFNLVWRKKLGDPDSPFTGLGDMIFSPDSCLLVTGQNVDSSMTFNAARILKIGLDGNVIWELRDTGYAFPDGQSLNFMEGIASSSCNSIYAVGYTYISAGFYEGLILKVSGDGCIDTLCTTTAIEDILRLQEQKIDAYPNPMQDELNIVLDELLPEDVSVSIYNTMGHLVFSDVMDGHKKTISVADWPAGLHVVQAISKGSVVASIKVVKSKR